MSDAEYATTCTKTLRQKVRPEAYPWLNRAAREVNQGFNWCNETSHKAARPFAGPRTWFRKNDLCELSAGVTEYFEHLGADTIQRVCDEYAARRRRFNKAKLRWRVSSG